MNENKLIVFKGKKIRREIFNNEWFFSVIDIIAALTGTDNPRRYWSDLKRKLSEKEGFSELYEKIVQLKLLSADGKRYETDCANAETLFRIIQSIPSPKAELFKRWLAKAGYERVQEIENPELATKRTRAPSIRRRVIPKTGSKRECAVLRLRNFERYQKEQIYLFEMH